MKYRILPFIYSIYGNSIKNGNVIIAKENTIAVQKFVKEFVNKGVLHSYSSISTMLTKFVAGEMADIS